MHNSINEIFEENKVLKKNGNILSYLRLLVFLVFILFFVLCLSKKNDLYYILMCIFFFLFVIFIIWHNKISRKLEKNSYKIKVFNDNEARRNLEFSHFNDKGEDFYNEENNYLLDLNILGENSLFQYLSMAKTKLGRKKLFSYLSNEEINFDLENRQDAIIELANNNCFFINFGSDLYEYGDIKKKRNIEKAINLFLHDNSKPKYLNLFNYIFYFILLLILLTSILSIFKVLNFFSVFLVLLLQFIFSLTYSIIYKNNNEEVVNAFGDYEDILKNFNFKFSNNKLKELSLKIINSNYKGLQRAKLLYDLKQNIFGFILGNALFSLNLLADIYYYKFKENQKIVDAIYAISDFEALLSLSILNRNFAVTRPKISKKIQIDVKDIYYPFIKNPVKNSIKMNDGCVIITGSNMSGKTSFLRTIGLNMILFKAGAFVLASDFVAYPLKVFTAINIKDEISKSISSFYKEILTVKKAIDYKKEKLVLIDEIFKGTNANDRITGAKSLIEKLKSKEVILMITTHDFELCEIQDVNNYHFSEFYVDDKINFDFTLKNGKCKTTNAIYLLKKANII